MLKFEQAPEFGGREIRFACPKVYEVSKNIIYVWSNGEADLTRWFALEMREPRTCVMYLTDLCSPGKVSRFGTAAFPIDYLRSALTSGPIQLTLETGYVIVRRDGHLVHVEHKHLDDVMPIKTSFLADDIAKRLRALERESLSIPA